MDQSVPSCVSFVMCQLISVTLVVCFGWNLEGWSIFTSHSTFNMDRGTPPCKWLYPKHCIMWHVMSEDTHMTFAEKMQTHTHDCSHTQTSACILSAAALVLWNTRALALRSAVRYTLLCKSDWDTQRDPVLGLRLPYKEYENRLRESSSVLLMLNLQSVLSLFLPSLSQAPSACFGLMAFETPSC